MGPATRKYVLGRLFAVLDANGSGMLEREVGRLACILSVVWAGLG